MPVRLVDSGTAGFGVSCCVWAAAEAVLDGADLESAVQVAETLAPRIGTLFVVGEPDFLRTGGSKDEAGVSVMTARDGQLEVVARVGTAADAVETIAEKAIAWGARLNVGVGMADLSGVRLTDSLAGVIGESANVREVVRYRIGPSVGAYAGLGIGGVLHVSYRVTGSSPSARTAQSSSQLRKL